MNHIEKLYSYHYASITEPELQKLINASEYSIFNITVEQLVNDGILVQVKASGLNGRLPPLFNKYRIIKPQKDYSEYLASILHLHTSLNITNYLSNPELYIKHRDIVDGLSHYLWYAKELLEAPMSRKERSFSIWGREKMIDEKYALLKEVLKFNGLEKKILNFYDTPEPFFEYVHARPELITVLILENKDTWFTFRKRMQETGNSTLAGVQVDVLLYGEGNKISKPGALEDFNTAMLGGRSVQTTRFLYLGDLDHEGIRLFFRARDANPQLNLTPFAQLYNLMLELAVSRELPRSLDNRGFEAPLEEFTILLGLDRSDELKSFLKKGRYIPQEIINYQIVSKILT